VAALILAKAVDNDRHSNKKSGGMLNDAGLASLVIDVMIDVA
jgi:hypothetical protein